MYSSTCFAASKPKLTACGLRSPGILGSICGPYMAIPTPFSLPFTKPWASQKCPKNVASVFFSSHVKLNWTVERVSDISLDLSKGQKETCSNKTVEDWLPTWLACRGNRQRHGSWDLCVCESISSEVATQWELHNIRIKDSKSFLWLYYL